MIDFHFVQSHCANTRLCKQSLLKKGVAKQKKKKMILSPILTFATLSLSLRKVCHKKIGK